MNNEKLIKNIFNFNSSLFAELSEKLAFVINKSANMIVDTYKKQGKVIIFGNGGSAADAQHFVAELVGRFQKERTPLPAIALNTNVSNITSISNDYGYDQLFLRQLIPFLQTNDTVIGISTSGNSPNVIAAIQYAKNQNNNTISLTGNDGGELAKISHININVPDKVTARIQEVHITILHILAEIIENTIFPSNL